MTKARQSLAVLAVLLCAAMPFLDPSYTYQLTITLAMGLGGLAVSILLRSGLISFGHALFYAIGAYSAAYIANGMGAGLASTLALSALISVLVALPIGLFICRYRGIFFAMLNLALSMVAYTVLLKFHGLTGGSDGMSVGVSSLFGWNLNADQYSNVLFYIVLLVAIGLGWVVHRYFKSPAGWGLLAVQDNEVRVEYLGVSARNLILLAYVLSALLAGIGGAVSALAVEQVVPDMSYWTMSAAFLIMAILGGSGSIFGPMVGALIYEVITVSGAQYLSDTWQLLLGAVIYGVIRFAPDGLWGLYDALWKKKPASRDRPWKSDGAPPFPEREARPASTASGKQTIRERVPSDRAPSISGRSDYRVGSSS